MILTAQHTQVLIVGAGPSGLMMAAQLIRHGVIPIIIDSKQGPTANSKALAVQARSLEIYRQMGVADKVMSGGKQASGMVFNYAGDEVATLDLSNVGEQRTPYPFVHLYPQSKNERVLLEYLTQNCCPVYWDTTLTVLTQTTDHTEAQLLSAGQNINLTSDWVIGADGAHSSVRKQLNIPFTGDVYDNQFFLADVELDHHDLDDKQVHLYLAKNGLAALFPLPEPNSYRLTANIPTDLVDKQDLQLADILPHLNTVTKKNISVANQHWFTTYKLHYRMAESFRQQRCFLVGDAAHIHSPVGGQGMNTGLQDAYNLAWKLAGVVKGQFKETILNSYSAERMPVAKTLLNTTDRVFRMIVSTNWFALAFKKWLLPKLIALAWKSEDLRRLFFERLSQLIIAYRDGHINLHLSNAKSIKAGDRLPYLKVFDEKKQGYTDLHEWCSKPGLTLIIMGKYTDLDLFTVAKWITQGYGNAINFFYLPPSAKNKELFEAFEVEEGKKKALIVRPDMHLGLVNDVVDIDMMDNYLTTVLGMIKLDQIVGL